MENNKCKKCKDEISDWNDNNLCCDCQEKEESKARKKTIYNYVILTLILALLILPISLYLAHIDFNYELEKCSKLQSSESNYDFEIKVETNAQYNAGCYYLKHHPMAYVGKMFIAGLTGVLVIAIIVMLTFLIKMILTPYETRGFY